ncbi:diacylglycerol kinase [Simiduia aestuariiviva]|uniref:Diacylglycerol kinase n=1 Tax=Simiduia aestuariiviva TaxID=1510459 RepID=A0A839UIK8_9GAMM|nr:diacylglycerol kinase (ATP) [Simiduia aestuariiviva]
MENERKGSQQGVARIVKATRYSWQGFKASWQTEAAFREEALLAAVLLPLAVWLDVTTVERVLLIAAVLLVLVVELINSALEAVVDRVGLQHHALSGKAKDAGSAAVFTTLTIAIFTWVLIVGERYFW